MTNDYRVILPLMFAVVVGLGGFAAVIAVFDLYPRGCARKGIRAADAGGMSKYWKRSR